MTHLSAENQMILRLLRCSLWGEPVCMPDAVNWERLNSVAREQGVVSFAYDAAVREGLQPPAEIYGKWKIHLDLFIFYLVHYMLFQKFQQ